MPSFEPKHAPNPSLNHLSWDGLHYQIKDRVILKGVSASVRAGELLAIMGPSGSGKTTLLDLLADRRGDSFNGDIYFNGSAHFNMTDISAYVEQEDALLGTLTVRESLSYSAKLSAGRIRETRQLSQNIQDMIVDLGLKDVAISRIGTPISRGISGGQKRRVSLGAAAVTLPEILFLDEVTSGLDSTAALKVIEAVKNLARRNNMIVIVVIHQPTFDLLSLFDNLLVLASGRTVYAGKPSDLAGFCENAGFPVPFHRNPSDHLINLVNADFDDQNSSTRERSEQLAALVSKSAPSKTEFAVLPSEKETRQSHFFARFIVLLERTTLNYSRNLLAYGIRGAMYIGMAVMMAIIWIKIGTEQDRVQDRLSVQFYAVAFLAFMSVAGIPTFLEDRAVYKREHANGLCGPGVFSLVQALASVPFLAGCVVLFSVIAYFAMGLHPGAGHFFRYMVYVFLAVYAAEGQTALVAAIVPIFVAALAVAAFANGFLMSVGGYFNMHLAAFWRYSFHYMDYQTYSFQLLARNDLLGLTFQCADTNGACHCIYESALQSQGQCAFSGQDVIRNLGYDNVNTGHWIGILISIALIYRLALYLVLAMPNWRAIRSRKEV